MKTRSNQVLPRSRFYPDVSNKMASLSPPHPPTVLFPVVVFILTKQMFVSGTMSERETTSSLPERVPELFAASSASKLPKRKKTQYVLKKNCLIWKRESVSSRPLYLWSAAWSCSVFAALCTSTPTELQRRVRAQNINSEWEGGTKTTVEVFGLTAAEGKWKQLLCCLMTG